MPIQSHGLTPSKVLLVAKCSLMVTAATAGPLLDAPSVVSATFTMDADAVVVQFDRPTLKGARPYYSPSTGRLNFIDYTQQLSGIFHCDEVFANASDLLPPWPEAFCTWENDEALRLQFEPPQLINILGAVKLRNDTIFGVPENDRAAASASGSWQAVPPPEPTPPVVVVHGRVLVGDDTDACLAVTHVSSTGRAFSVQWTLPPGSPDAPNPQDLMEIPPRRFDENRLNRIRARLADHSTTSALVLVLPIQDLEVSSALRIQIQVTNRWGVASTKTATIQRLVPLPQGARQLSIPSQCTPATTNLLP